MFPILASCLDHHTTLRLGELCRIYSGFSVVSLAAGLPWDRSHRASPTPHACWLRHGGGQQLLRSHGSFEFSLYKEGGFIGYRKIGVPSRVPYKASNETLKTRGVLCVLSRHSAQWPLVSLKMYKYCIIVLSYAIVSAKLSALRYFYLFVLGSINIYINMQLLFYIFLAHWKLCML